MADSSQLCRVPLSNRQKPARIQILRTVSSALMAKHWTLASSFHSEWLDDGERQIWDQFVFVTSRLLARRCSWYLTFESQVRSSFTGKTVNLYFKFYLYNDTEHVDVSISFVLLLRSSYLIKGQCPILLFQVFISSKPLLIFPSSQISRQIIFLIDLQHCHTV